ncbi:MAG: MATE family efflux transporter [Bacteroidales bacterium]|nr:MATE family efflux transporter [Bacteroidales bacterium]
MTAKHYELGKANINSLLIKLSLPSMLAMFANAIYNLVDTIFVGRGVGSLGIGAVAIVLPIVAIVSSFAHLIGIGSATLMSRQLGAGKEKWVNRIAGNGMFLVILVGIFFCVIGEIFTDPILKTFGATPGILPYARDFARILFVGMLWFPFCVSTSNYLRAEGNAREAMYAMLVGIGVNTLLDYIFIFPMNMGIQGAALATILGKLTTFIYLIGYFTSSKSIIRIRFRHFRITKKILKPTISVGLSGFGMRSSSSVANVALNHMLGFYGGDMAIAVFGVIYKTTLFLGMPLFGLNQGMQPIVGYNFGAEKYDRILKTIRLGFTYSLIYGMIAIIIFEIFPREIFSLFTNDSALLSEGTHAMKIVLSMMWLLGISISSTGIHQAMGKPRAAFFLAILRWVILITPLIFILPRIGGLGLDGIWLAFPVADMLAAFISLRILTQTLRKNNIRIRLIPKIPLRNQNRF